MCPTQSITFGGQNVCLWYWFWSPGQGIVQFCYCILLHFITKKPSMTNTLGLRIYLALRQNPPAKVSTSWWFLLEPFYIMMAAKWFPSSTIPSTYISWHSTIRNPFSPIYLCIYLLFVHTLMVPTPGSAIHNRGWLKYCGRMGCLGSSVG